MFSPFTFDVIIIHMLECRFNLIIFCFTPLFFCALVFAFLLFYYLIFFSFGNSTFFLSFLFLGNSTLICLLFLKIPPELFNICSRDYTMKNLTFHFNIEQLVKMRNFACIPLLLYCMLSLSDISYLHKFETHKTTLHIFFIQVCVFSRD